MLKLSFEQFQELLLQHGKKIEKENRSEGIYHTSYDSNIDTSLCKGSAHNISIRNEITLIMVQLTFFQETTIEMKSFLPQVGFWYCLKGHIDGYRQNTEPKEITQHYYSLSPNKGFIYATTASQGWIQPQKDMPYKAMYMIFNHQIFKQLVGDQLYSMPKEFIEAIEDANGYYMKPISINSQIKALCEAIFDNPYSGKSRQFYREAKVIELLAYWIDKLTKPMNELEASGVKLTPSEEKRVAYCQQVLISSLESPPSLLDLAEQVGMSSYRLKQGFKQMFGLTPFGFVVDQRMKKAKQLLLQRKLTVQEVASSVGYTSLGTFSNSFYEKYGIRPSEI